VPTELFDVSVWQGNRLSKSFIEQPLKKCEQESGDFDLVDFDLDSLATAVDKRKMFEASDCIDLSSIFFRGD
jgi:hypothetical protein